MVFFFDKILTNLGQNNFSYILFLVQNFEILINNDFSK